MFGETKTETMKDLPVPEIPRDAIKACIECFEVNEATDRIVEYIESMIEADRSHLKLMMRLKEIETIFENHKQNGRNQ